MGYNGGRVDYVKMIREIRFAMPYSSPEKRRDQQRRYREANREKMEAYRRNYYQANRERLREQQRQYHATHREQIRAKQSAWKKTPNGHECYRRWYEANKDRVSASNAKYRQEHRDELNAYLRRWREGNPDKMREWREKNREQLRQKYREEWKADKSLTGTEAIEHRRRMREAYKRYYRRNRERFIAKSIKRRAKIIGEDAACIDFIKSMQSAKIIACYWCSKPTRRGKRHIDHIKPIAKGGAHCVFNLCCSCPDCNRRKGAKHPEEWSGQFHLDFSQGR